MTWKCRKKVHLSLSWMKFHWNLVRIFDETESIVIGTFSSIGFLILVQGIALSNKYQNFLKVEFSQAIFMTNFKATLMTVGSLVFYTVAGSLVYFMYQGLFSTLWRISHSIIIFAKMTRLLSTWKLDGVLLEEPLVFYFWFLLSFLYSTGTQSALTVLKPAQIIREWLRLREQEEDSSETATELNCFILFVRVQNPPSFCRSGAELWSCLRKNQ